MDGTSTTASVARKGTGPLIFIGFRACVVCGLSVNALRIFATPVRVRCRLFQLSATRCWPSLSALHLGGEMFQSGMAGTWLNVMAIVVGGVFGLFIRRAFSATNQSFIKLVLGACAIWFGLRLTWISVHGSLLQILKQIGIVVAALALGRLSGRLLH